MKKSISTLGIIALISGASLNAQVGVNTETPVATLDVVAGNSSIAKGMIVPRMTLAQLNTERARYTAAQEGAAVYITNVSGATIAGYSDQVICTGIAYWNGTYWVTSCATPDQWVKINTQPKAFTFYELGTETPVALTVSAIGSSTLSYQWWKVAGGNVHVRIGQKCTATDGTGFATANFTPTSVKKGTTRDANNTGFYRYYCVVKNTNNDSVISNMAEVAVGCGAKNKDGEWLSFMCFNLGATQMTIAAQRNTALNIGTNNGLHAYVTGEEQKYGDLYQWGRIRDGHEQRGTSAGFVNGSYAAGANQIAYSSTTPPAYENGNTISGQTYPLPYIQIKRNTTYYGKFITTLPNLNYDWANPAITVFGVQQSSIDNLWLTGAANDPCKKINADGTTYTKFHPEATDPAGATTNWRIPTQSEWGEIYRGGELAGTFANALSNTWTWHGSNGGGFDLKPDGVTITLHLPSTGYRSSGVGTLHRQGTNGHYWSATPTGTSAYTLIFIHSAITPAATSERGTGMAIRCIRAI